MNFIKNYFQLDKYHTSVKVEFIAGLTTFISMSYILFVNPSVLGASGMNTGAVFTATALASLIGTLLILPLWVSLLITRLVRHQHWVSMPFLLTLFVWECTFLGKQL